MFGNNKLLVMAAFMCFPSFFVTQAPAQAHVTKVKGVDVLINGDSFFAMSGQIKTELEKLARADGYIGSSESFRNAAVSGAVLTGIMGQYQNTNPKPIYVIQDAGGNDCLMNSPNNAKNNCQAFLEKMKAGGTKKVLWMRYPEPMGSMASGSLKSNLDGLMPEIEKMCRASQSPKVLWVDLRPVWGNNSGYAQSDGIHPTAAGSKVTAEAFWKAIKDSNFFDTGSAVTSGRQTFTNGKTAPSVLRGQTVSNTAILLSLFIAQPAAVSVRITAISGRMTVRASPQVRVPGLQTVEIPRGAIAPGVYCLEVQTGRVSESSAFLVR